MSDSNKARHSTRTKTWKDTVYASRCQAQARAKRKQRQTQQRRTRDKALVRKDERSS
jgi:hypothetical protein